MNGGATGAYHISAPWGDSALASYYGTSAVLQGSESTEGVFASMRERPQAFPFPAPEDTAQDRGSACDQCKSEAGPLGWAKCYPEPCWFQTPGPKVGMGLLDFTSLPVLAIGVGLVLIGALALTR